MSDRFTAALWNQQIYAECAREVDPYVHSDRFRRRDCGFDGNRTFWAIPSPEPKLANTLVKRLEEPLQRKHPICVAATHLAATIADRFEPSSLLFVGILRAGVPLVDWLTQMLPGSVGVATSLFVGHGIDRVSFENIQADHPSRQIIFVDGWTGKGGVANEISRLDSGHLAVLSDPWGHATFRGTHRDILSPTACYTGPMTLGFSRTFTRSDKQCFAAYRFPIDLLQPTVTQAWIRSCPIDMQVNPVGKRSNHLPRNAKKWTSLTPLRVHSNEVCRALINSNPTEIFFACSKAEAQYRYDLLLELADNQSIPQKFSVRHLSTIRAEVACSLDLN